jgi:hypothetical protein
VLLATVFAKLKKLLGRVVLTREPIHDQAVLVAEHVLQAAFAHEPVTRFGTVDGVAEVLVVGAHGLRNGLRSPASTEEMANGLLAYPDLGERAIEVRVNDEPSAAVVSNQSPATSHLLNEV